MTSTMGIATQELTKTMAKTLLMCHCYLSFDLKPWSEGKVGQGKVGGTDAPDSRL